MNSFMLVVGLLVTGVTYAAPVVKVQVPGKRPQMRVTITGVVEVPADLWPSIKIGLVGYEGGAAWMPVTTVDGGGRFAFETRLSRGEYRVTAALGQYQIAMEPIAVSENKKRAFDVRLKARPDTGERFDLRSDVPLTVPDEKMLANPDVVYPAPPPPPPPPPPGWQKDKKQVRVYYATHRELKSGLSEGVLKVNGSPFLNQVGKLRFGYYDVGFSFQRGQMYNPLSEDAYRFSIQQVMLYRDGATFSGAVGDQLKSASVKEVLLLVHGYNTPFEDAILRTAQFTAELGFNGVPVCYAWTGGERWFEYLSARDRVGAASTDLAQVLLMLAGNSAVVKLNVVAHSLGNSVLVDALEKVSKEAGFARAKVGDVIMAAPDVARARFGQLADLIGGMGRRRTIYVSDSDIALQVSQRLNGGPRLGMRPPVTIVKGFDTIDSSGARDTVLGHSYFINTDYVALDIRKLLLEGVAPAGRGLQAATEDGKQYWKLVGGR